MNKFPKQSGKYGKIFKSIRKIGLVFPLVFFALSIARIQGTNSLFTDEATISGSTFSAGYWIPDLTMAVLPANPDGENGFYKTTPCVTLAADIQGETNGITIFYEFSDDGDPISSGTIYEGICVPIPDGNPTHFQAQAVNDENPDWKSNIVSQDFKVNTSSSFKAGDVIINEVMWMGSKDTGSPSDDGPNDQWIELKNVSGRDLHLKGLFLTFKNNATGEEDRLAEIGNNRIVKDGEYFLISHFGKSNSAINVQRDDTMINFDYSDFQIKLYADDTKSLLIDTAGGGSGEPTKGNEAEFYSMERNDTPGEGANYSNWHNCESSSSTSLYWDSGRTERGTPGHDNLSENDPTDNGSKKVKYEEPAPLEDNVTEDIQEGEFEITTDTPELAYNASKSARKKVNIVVSGLSLSKKKWTKVRVNGKIIPILKLRKRGNDTVLLLNLKYKKWEIGKYDLTLYYKNREKQSVTNKKGKVIQKNVWIWKTIVGHEVFSII